MRVLARCRSARTRGPRRIELRLVLCVAVVVMGLSTSPSRGAAATLDDALGQEVSTNTASAGSQKKVDALSDDIDSLAAAYRVALQEARSLEIYNRQLESLSASQDREIESLKRQIDQVTVVSREIMPLMVRMIDALETFVDLDVPFLLDERKARVAGLREMMDRADVTISEKYRRLMEAYQIENDYGRNIEAYSAELTQGGAPRTVEFLRVGRVALLYQTLDGQETGAWDQKARQWVQLGDEYRNSVRDGLRMARKEIAPDLVRIPAPAAVSAEVKP